MIFLLAGESQRRFEPAETMKELPEDDRMDKQDFNGLLYQSGSLTCCIAIEMM